MSRRKQFVIILSLPVLVGQAFSDVPPPRVHQPDVPFFLESMHLQTIQMRVFPSEAAGMVIDPYSDLIWNPAYILQRSKKSVYLDLNPQLQSSLALVSLPIYPEYVSPEYYYNNLDAFGGDAVLPSWYGGTSINTVQTSPHYNVAAVVPIGTRLAFGVMNRLIFDYGPFRSIPSYGWRNDAAAEFTGDYEPQRLEIDDNQQTVIGTQTELLIGYRLSSRIDLGLRLGHYVYDRDGNLYDSKWAFYPHSSYANLNDESFEIDGHHFETGLGVICHLGNKTRLGCYGGFLNGKSSEGIASLDTSYTWSERDTDTTYYSIYDYWLQRRESYSCDGERPEVAITFERDISPKLLFRSFFSYTWLDQDVSGSTFSADTTFGDRTYDDWDNGSYHFRRQQSHSSRESALLGTGTNSTKQLRWFASLIYAPNNDWSLFGGVQIQRRSFQQKIDESSDYTSHAWREYSIYHPETYRESSLYEKLYSFEAHYTEWSVFLPIGLRARVVKGVYVVLGTDVQLTLTDQDSGGRLLYPKRITRKWEDGGLVIEDEEIDRYEEYRSDPAKDFERTLGHRFGITYEHPSGAKLYIRSFGDVFHSENWALGFEMNW